MNSAVHHPSVAPVQESSRRRFSTSNLAHHTVDQDQFASIPMEDNPSSPDLDQPKKMSSLPTSLSRFKRVANHVMNARFLASQSTRGQGVDVSGSMDHMYGVISRKCEVTAIDMDDQRMSHLTMDNQEFITWLQKPRPDWATVRWINVDGMSWDIIKALGSAYDLHRLAVEDLLHVPQRTKMDPYPNNQTYISCTLLTLLESLEDGYQKQVDPFGRHHGINPEAFSSRIPLELYDRYKNQFPAATSFGNLKVQLEQVTIFLLDNGTLITIFQVSGKTIVNPMVERLNLKMSLARRNNDASFLLQSIMDSIVDCAIPITDAFRQEINQIEDQVLEKPQMLLTKDLHRLSTQLLMLKRTLVPMQGLVHILRDQRDTRSPLSKLAKTYMNDVGDHVNTLVDDLEAMLQSAESLINLTFNIIAHDTNESMKLLALVSVIFLPVTFIAGVYGTNFTDFPELDHNISYFWYRCLGATAVVLFLMILPKLITYGKQRYLKGAILNASEPVSIQGRDARGKRRRM